ncbi:hypothetical protein DY000_02058501 [Brassica cretica]|uniref:Arabidopsis retrotransposon Orf1 C-terminal domain-containing protein n=1 Tax=Brassica cretica TaxID=69181 RepID=A0ABQ7ANW2_BRACR|nr:hypothetical protein DY000_02058501 [Brassica cretica]
MEQLIACSSQFPPIYKMSRTKQSAKRTRVNLARNTPPLQAQQPTSASYPWPRKQAGRYNSLLKVDILPTSFGHAETLADLGIDEDVFETLQAMGIAPLCYQAHELYPDLARQMPHTKQSAKRTRVNLASNTPPPRAQQPTSASYPWPREQGGEPIDLNSPMLLDFNCEGWDKETAGRYNSLLKVDILPTRFGHAETLADLGINEDVFETLQAMGIAPLCYQAHELYPDLDRQVLATATITYEDSSAPSYANYSFSFMANGEYCSLSLDKLNEIYEIANEPRGVAVAKKFAPSNAFWDFIANGNFTPGKAYQSQIRNPTLRVIAKNILNLMFAKDQTSKVTNGELQTLYAGIEDEVRASGSGIPIQKVKMNPGFHCERRQCLMHGSNKKDRSGSLLTPLFKHFSIDLGKYKLLRQGGYPAVHQAASPQDHQAQRFDNIRFLPPPELLCIDPRAAAPDANIKDVKDITPEADPSYDLRELADVTDDQAYRRWMVDSQRKNNSLMRRILHLVTGGCIGGSNQRQSPAAQTPRPHRPGKEPMGTGPSTEEVNTEIQYLDIKYLMACHIMRDEDTYSFFDKEGTQLFTKLPHPEITRLRVFDNIRFLRPPELLCTDPRAAAPDANMEDVEDITTEDYPSYDLGELADVTDDQAYRRWMVDSQRKNNSLMRRILHLVTGGCIGGSNQRQSPAAQTPRPHRPGKEPM